MHHVYQKTEQMYILNQVRHKSILYKVLSTICLKITFYIQQIVTILGKMNNSGTSKCFLSEPLMISEKQSIYLLYATRYFSL